MGNSVETNNGLFKRIVVEAVRMVLAAMFVLPVFGQSGAILTTLQTGISMAQAPLVQGNDGYFYGTGYTPPHGEVFKVGADGTLTHLYAFTDGMNGSIPMGLVQGSDGYLYGVTTRGGTNNFGSVYKISTGGAFTNLYTFTGGADGGVPETRLVQGSDGYFYGTTEEGGANTNVVSAGAGTVFKISTDGSLTSLYSFTGGSDGSGPGGLVLGSDGYLYGTTFYGAGGAGYGTVFKISPMSGALTTLYTFTGGSDGGYPSSAAVIAAGADGNFYGTTLFGGTANLGTVFKINTNGSLITLHSFAGGSEGRGSDLNAMMQSSDGYLYGNTSSSIFRVSAAGTVSTLYSVTSGQLNGLVQGSDGYFYGTTFFDMTGNRFFRLMVLPVFQPVARTNDTLTLTWRTEPGWKYQLMYSSDLSSGTWTALGDVSTAPGATLTATDSVTNALQRFYRVALLP
jgi:uncharacterized repeat protein (TIGR03803 family)